MLKRPDHPSKLSDRSEWRSSKDGHPWERARKTVKKEDGFGLNGLNSGRGRSLLSTICPKADPTTWIVETYAACERLESPKC